MIHTRGVESSSLPLAIKSSIMRKHGAFLLRSKVYDTDPEICNIDICRYFGFLKRNVRKDDFIFLFMILYIYNFVWELI